MKYCPICGEEYDSGDRCPADGGVLLESAREVGSLVGQVFKGSYRIEEKIAEGGMGVVYRGVQTALQRNVAIKVLLPEMHSTPSMIRRFFQEARLLSQIDHPHVVSVIDFGNTKDGILFMVMEYLQGQTLREIVAEQGGLPLGAVVRLMEQICLAVGAAHDAQLIHRDLKPDNIFIATRQSAPETVKILDFGLARVVEGREDARLTRTGLLMGTAGFVAPEQITGGEADARSDIYALGGILYYMIAGRLPFEGEAIHAILTEQLRGAPDLSAGPLADYPTLGEVISRAMAREPAGRFRSARELLGALRKAAADLDPELTLSELDPIDLANETKVWGGRDQGVLPSASDGKHGPKREDPPTPRLAWRGLSIVGVVLVLLVGAWWMGQRAGAPEAIDAEGTPILVGMSAAFSGPSRELGRAMQLGIETCFADVNESGGIGGRDLQLVALDDGYEPARTVANMADLLLERRVVAILGNVGTPTAEVALPLALEQGVPFFGAFSGAELLRREPPDRLVFNFRASYAEETAAIVDHFVGPLGLQPAEIAVFAQEDGFGDEGYHGVVRALAAHGYEGDVPRFGYRRNTESIETAIDSILQRRGELRGLVLVATYRTATRLIQRLREAEVAMTFAGLSFVGSNAFAQELTSLGPQLSEGVLVSQVVPHFHSELPGVSRYRALLARHFPSEQPGFVSLEGFLAARVFVEALRTAGGDTSADALVVAAESLAAVDLGLGTEISFSAARHQGSDQVWLTVLDSRGSYHPVVP